MKSHLLTKRRVSAEVPTATNDRELNLESSANTFKPHRFWYSSATEKSALLAFVQLHYRHIPIHSNQTHLLLPENHELHYLYSNATNIHPDLLPCRIPSTGATRSSHKQQDRDWNKVCFPWELNYIEGRWGWRKVDIGLLFSRERTGSLMFVSSKLCAVQALRQFCLFTIWGRRRWRSENS